MLVPGTPLNQNCWVVADLDAAIRNWIALGVGPFYTFEYDFRTALYRGDPVPLAFRAALAQAGPVQIELIEQVSPGPSAYRDAVPQGATGFHHVCKITDDYDRDVAALRDRGIILATELDSNGIPSCYADTREEIGSMLELVPDVPILRAMGKLVADGARDWTGKDAVRNGMDELAALL